jgi:hypothetical protein
VRPTRTRRGAQVEGSGLAGQASAGYDYLAPARPDDAGADAAGSEEAEGETLRRAPAVTAAPRAPPATQRVLRILCRVPHPKTTAVCVEQRSHSTVAGTQQALVSGNSLHVAKWPCEKYPFASSRRRQCAEGFCFYRGGTQRAARRADTYLPIQAFGLWGQGCLARQLCPPVA